MSRTKNTIKNFSANFTRMTITVILSFIVRTIFIQVFGKEYLGLNGLYSNIFSVLSLTELGIGTAISYKLYKPLAINDQKKIIILMKFYRTAYRLISIIIFFIGLVILPFLSTIIKEDIQFINIYAVFLIYLLQAVASYSLFAYKSTLIKADQKEYKVAGVILGVDIGVSVIQIATMVLLENFYLYTFILVFSNLLKNYFIAAKVNKDYAYINTNIEEKLSKDELMEMFKDLASVFLYKINIVVLNATDNIVISAFLGVAYVGIYSNYILITNTIKNFTNTFYNAIKASIGNLHASSTEEQEYLIFSSINLIAVALSGVGAIGVAVVSKSFISLWIGDEFVLSRAFTILLSVELYLRGIQSFLAQFRTSMGLFRQAKFRPLASMLINLLISIIFVQFLGINGVVLGTILAILLTTMWYDPLVIFNVGFKKSPKYYYVKNFFFFATTFFIGFISNFIVEQISVNNILTLILKILIVIGVSFSVYYISFMKLKEMKYLKDLFKRVITKR